MDARGQPELAVIAPLAPEGEQTHILTIVENDGALSGNCEFAGRELTITQFEFANGRLSFSFTDEQAGLRARFAGEVDGNAARGVTEIEDAERIMELDWTARRNQ